MTAKLYRENKKGDSGKSLTLFILSFLIPGCIFLLSMLLVGAAPFGDNTILLRDSIGQYIDFVSYLKTVLRGENNIFYTFSKTLGGDMLSLASYYLLSPFNLLFLFSNNYNIPMFYTAVAVLKLSTCGATFYWAAQKRYGAKYSHLLFSTAYALMAYNVLYQWNIMWMDGVIVLPLMGLGVERIWENKSPTLYILSLAYALATNFYIGYMLCIASVLFCLARFILFNGSLRQRMRLLGRYIFASCISGFAAAFVWLPAFLSLSKGRSQFGSEIFSFALNFNPLQLCAKVVAGSGGPAQLDIGLPHIFCGTAILFLALQFFLSSKVSKKVRATAFGVVLAVTGSFLFKFTDVAWHGFSPNNAFNFRYAFVWSYIIIVIAQYALSKNLTDSFPKCLAAAGIFGLMYIALLIVGYDYVRPVGIACGACVIVAVLFLVRHLDRKRLAGILICIVGIAELGANCFLLLDGVVGVEGVWTLRMSEWDSKVPEISQPVNYVKQQDKGFYRMEQTFHRTHNDAMFYSYNGLSHFSSAGGALVPRFVQKMGLRNYYDIWAFYDTGSTAEVDSLLGVKYVLSKTDLTEQKGYKLLTQKGDVGVYQNTNALPLAMLSSPKVLEVDTNGEDFFALHNDIWSEICGEDMQVLKQVDEYSASLVNLESSVNSDGNTVYTKIDGSEEAAVRYEINITREMPLYYYFTAPGTPKATVRVNGQDRGAYFSDYSWHIAYAGTYKPGDTVVIELVLNGESIRVGESYFYYEDLQAHAEATDIIKTNQVELQKQSSSHIDGQVTALQDGYIMFTIPYSESWQLSIDGVPVQTEMVLDTFIAAQITAGSHTLSLNYIPKGLYVGCALSVLAIAVAVMDALLKKRNKVYDI